MTCRDCKLFDLDATKNKAGRVMKAKSARCLWVSKEQYPHSILSPFGRPRAGYMTAVDGYNCPCFQKRNDQL